MNQYKVYFLGKNFEGKMVDCSTQPIIAKNENEAVEKFKKSKLYKSKLFWYFC
ncbi:hypothetical protein [Photorhabdus hainanensis]|uniref:hypothetical protein n=1 Tax=Photorhabdus hainanensis TaxID=1004166 RepID=UPI001BD40637|nr:hypothetical protein [Photorhabdus hainanensis]